METDTGGRGEAVIAVEDRAELRILATRTLKRVLGDDAPSRNAGVQVTAATAILDRVWPKPSVSSSTNVQVNVLVNGGVTAIEAWESRHEEAPHQDA